MKTCPFCAEEIQDAAIKCKHCGSMLDSSIEPVRQNTASEIDLGLQKQKRRNALSASIAGITFISAIFGGLNFGSWAVFFVVCIIGLVISLVVYLGD